ncbi:MAG: ABC transporter permease [Oscillospiraceae bacterium]|jgi:ribose/xylose/arabinose/galactoside ABC-type transport system permease subunit|nr:ABC transporter permease [Oscillospiraceae bacterium]
MPKQSFIKKTIQSKPFLLLVITAAVLVLTAIVKPVAFSLANGRELLQRLSYSLVFLCGVSMLLISGGIDFGLSSMASAATVVFAQLVKLKMPWGGAAVIALAFGAVAGLINAFLVNKLNMMSFIATIGMSSVWAGFAAWYTRGMQISVVSATFNKISKIYVGQLVPLVFIIGAALVVIYSLVLKHTKFGRSILVIGGNQAAARLAGLKPKLVSSLLFVNASVLGVIGGLIFASQQKAGGPALLTTTAPEMTALTASILGGVAFSGGSGSLFGAFAGVILIQVLAYALQVMIPTLTWVQLFVNGMLLVVALTVDGITMQRRLRKLGIKSSGGGMIMPGAR